MRSIPTCFARSSFAVGLLLLGAVARGQEVVDSPVEGRMTPLCAAAQKGDLAAVQKLVAAGADPLVMDGEDADGNDMCAVAAAVRGGQIAVVEWFLAQGVDMGAVVNSNGDGLIHAACNADQFIMAQWLLAHGAEVDQLSEGGTTALEDEASNGHAKGVQWLLDHGAEVNHVTETGWTPLHSAAVGGRAACVKLLLDAGAALDAEDQDGDTVWSVMAYADYSEELAQIVDLLLAKGATLDPESETASQLFISAIDDDCIPLVAKLLDLGVPIPATEEDRAAEVTSVPMARLLLKHGADILSYPGIAQTLLCDAASRGDFKALDSLLGQGLELPHAVLVAAARAGQREMVQKLMQMGLDPAATDESGSSAVLDAAGAETDGVLAFFLNEKLVDAKDPRFLVAAATAGCAASIELLVKAGADVNAADTEQTESGLRPLQLAAINGHVEAVAALLAAGADRDAVDEDGKTALDYARENDHPEIVKLLAR